MPARLFETDEALTMVQVVECRSRTTRWCPLEVVRNPKGHVLRFRVKLQAQDLPVTFDRRGRSSACPHWAMVARLRGPEGTAADVRSELGYVPGPLPEPPPVRPSRKRPKEPDPRQLTFGGVDDGGDQE